MSPRRLAARSWSAAQIHQALAGRWAGVLSQLGIDERHLRNKHGPCPACGGRDRFRFDDRDGRGSWFCNGCGAGDGFRLLQLVNRWSFAEARRAIVDVLCLNADAPQLRLPEQRRPPPAAIASPTARVRQLLRTATAPNAVQDVIEYLGHRGLWPLPAGCIWRAHAGAEYWHDGQQIGLFPALVADVRDAAGELVTAHVTYLWDGRKLDGYEPRKFVSPMTGRRGCAVRLLPLAEDAAVLGIAEGIETALAAHQLHGVPVWSALNAALLAKFTPPTIVRELHVFADRDVAGLEAAHRLRDALDGDVHVVVKIPPAPAKDWNDALLAGAAA